MGKLFALTLMLLPWPLAGQTSSPPRQCPPVDTDTIALSGVLERRTFPGPPNYASTAGGDAPETGFYLSLPAPLCVQPESVAPNQQPLDGGTLVQLILDSAGYDRLRPALDSVTTVRGVLVEAISGHHHTPFLLSVTAP